MPIYDCTATIAPYAYGDFAPRAGRPWGPTTILLPNVNAINIQKFLLHVIRSRSLV
jgi:hypothetical protein